MISAIILLGVVVLVVAGLALLRSRQSPVSKTRDVDPREVEREVYEKLYGERSAAVSGAVPLNPSPEARADDARALSPSVPSDGSPLPPSVPATTD